MGAHFQYSSHAHTPRLTWASASGWCFGRGNLCFLFNRAKVSDSQKGTGYQKTRCAPAAAPACVSTPRYRPSPRFPAWGQGCERGSTVPQSTRDPLLLCEHVCCRRTFTPIDTGVIAEGSKMSSITSAHAFQREGEPKHLFVQSHFSTSLHEVQSPQTQAQTEKEAGCTLGISLAPAPPEIG